MPQPFYTIRARADNSAEVLIYGDIGESWWGESVTAKDFVREIAALDVDKLTVRINSMGGSVPDGIAIYNAIKRHKAHVTTVNDSLAASIASLILMAGDTVEMAENSLLMIHAPWGMAMGNSADMREFADMLDTWAQAMATSYSTKTARDHADMLALLTDGTDHWYTADEALSEKFIDSTTPALALAASFDRAAIAARFKSRPAPDGKFAAAAAQPAHKETQMPEQITPAAQAQAATHEDAIRAGAQAEAKRRTDIKALATGHVAAFAGIGEVLAACENDTGCTVDLARERILAHMAKDATPLAGHHVVTVEDESIKVRSAIANALMARAAVNGADGKAVRADSANPFRGMSLLDLAHASLARAGINTKGMDKMGVVAAAFTQSGSDFPVLLENAMHKTLQAAYATAPDTWSRFCAIGSVSDFRAHNRYRVGSLGNLDTVGENAEYKNKEIPDGEKSSITALTKGNIINVSRQMVINDDLGAFIGLAAAQVAPIHADTRKMNGAAVLGNGTAGDKWRGV